MRLFGPALIFACALILVFGVAAIVRAKGGASRVAQEVTIDREEER